MQTKTQLEDIQDYLTDASNMPGGHAEKLFVPESAEEVSEILREANENHIPVTVSGARTGTVGGAVPFGGYVISMERLNKIKEIDRENDVSVVEPGVILRDLQQAVEAQGLVYPPDPTEWSCQIGGTVATNASGARSFKYGSTRDYVEQLIVILADGDILEINRGQSVSENGEPLELVTESRRRIEIRPPTYVRPNVRKNVSGYFNSRPFDVIDLFIGSEGTLGVIAEIELKLKKKPNETFSGIIFFTDESDLLRFVADLRDQSFGCRERLSNFINGTRRRYVNPLKPGCLVVTDELVIENYQFDAALIEYFDDRALKFIAEKFPETPNMAGAVFFELDNILSSEEVMLEALNRLLERHNCDIEGSWFATNESDREKMRAFRHALPVSVNERVVRNKQKKIGTDMAVPNETFPGFLKYQKEMLDASGIDYVIFGHIGDCHLHANLLPKNETEAEHARHLYGRFIAQAIMLGGCVSAEHGIGKLKRKYLDAMMGERYIHEMAEIKKVFDPNGILGRGNMFNEKVLG